jgi:hypothetical protein
VKKKRSPIEKKVLSYQKDRRNTYGENSKSSRKAIRFRKAWVNRSYRHAIRRELPLTETGPDFVDNPSDRVPRKRWKKKADAPLGEVVDRKLSRRDQDGMIAAEPSKSRLRQEARSRRKHS